MKTQKKKRRKLRIKRLFFLLLIIVVISFACVKLVNAPISSIIISGNTILTDQEIIETANLEDYPSFFGTFSFSVRRKLVKNPYIMDAKVSKGFFSIKIKITEKKILYVDSSTGNKVSIDGEFKDDKTVCAPYLVNVVPNNKLNGFKKAMNKIDENILCQMSQIKYDPNNIDEDRYYVYMNDGNSVYLTVNKFNKINKYNSILENIGKQNGTLYLDYGDYFEVK